MRKTLVLFAVLIASAPAFARSKSGLLANLPDQAATATTSPFDMGEVSRFSVQVNWSSATLANVTFTEANVNSQTELVTATNSYGLGQGVSFSTGTNVALTGLTWGTTYFIIPVSQGRTFKFATTYTNAVAGTAVDITTTTAGASYVLTASSATVGSSFILQQSNDNANWATAASTGTVTVGQVSGTSTLFYDGQFFNARYLRLNYTKPTAGGLNIEVWVNGKNDD